jgi:hypothetical protein
LKRIGLISSIPVHGKEKEAYRESKYNHLYYLNQMSETKKKLKKMPDNDFYTEGWLAATELYRKLKRPDRRENFYRRYAHERALQDFKVQLETSRKGHIDWWRSGKASRIPLRTRYARSNESIFPDVIFAWWNVSVYLDRYIHSLSVIVDS